MNPTLINSINPLQEHLEKQEAIQRHNNILGYFLMFCLGVLFCYYIMKNQHLFWIKIHKKDEI